jgi:hypothetical protein
VATVAQAALTVPDASLRRWRAVASGLVLLVGGAALLALGLRRAGVTIDWLTGPRELDPLAAGLTVAGGLLLLAVPFAVAALARPRRRLLAGGAAAVAGGVAVALAVAAAREELMPVLWVSAGGAVALRTGDAARWGWRSAAVVALTGVSALLWWLVGADPLTPLVALPVVAWVDARSR